MPGVNEAPVSLPRLAGEIAVSRIPVILVNLADRLVLSISDVAAELFVRPASELVGWPWESLWDEIHTAAAGQALAALSDGAIDTYRTTRTIRQPSGHLDVWVWVRTVQFEGGSAAIAVAAPVGGLDEGGRLLDRDFGPDAIDIVIGTVDEQSRQRVAMRRYDQPGSDRHEAAPSTDVTAPVALDDASAAAWLADLERQILLIAAELHAVGDTRQHGVVDSQRSSLHGLPPKQREIVERLLRGERVPTIAAEMFLSPSTVRNHLSKVFRTFGVNSQPSLLAALRSKEPKAELAEPRAGGSAGNQ